MSSKIKDAIENAREVEAGENPSPQSSPADNTGTIPVADKKLPRDARNAELIAQDPKLTDCSDEPETDIGNGRRFLHRHRSKVMHVPNVGWHIYDGRRWKWDETDSQIRKLAHDTAERIANERFLIEYLSYEQRIIDEATDGMAEYNELKNKKPSDLGDEQRERLRNLRQLMDEADQTKKALQSRRSSRQRHAKSSAGSSKIDNILREAQPYITKELSELDNDPLAINCLNGLLVFKEHHYSTGPYWDLELKPHRQDAYVTKLVQAEYDPEARAPNFHKFLDEVQPNEEVRDYIQRYLGYCLTGLTHEQVFAFFHGGGRNGKSTLVDIVCRILDDYSTTVPIETLAGDQKRKGSDATPDLMRVPGARLVRASEPESNMKFKESMIKSLTSDEPILIRGLNKEFNEVYPNFKLTISGNHKPQIHNDDQGIWRRVNLVPWSVQVPPEKVDKMLGKKLWDERNGIFAWLVQGVMEYLTNGLNPPDEVTAATAEYRSDSNPIGAFLDTYCEFTGNEADELAGGEVHEFYERVREKEGWSHFASTTFTRRLPDQIESRGGMKGKRHGLARYIGVRLKTEMDVPPAAMDGFDDPKFDPPGYQR